MRGSEGVLGVGAEHFELGAKELQLVEGVTHVRVGRVALDFGVKLGNGEACVDDIAFELGDVDAVGCESTQRFVKRCRDTAYLKNEARHAGAVARIGLDPRTRHDDEARSVAQPVFDTRAQHVECVDFTRETRGNRGNRHVAAFGNVPGRTGGVRGVHDVDFELADQAPALRKRLGMTLDCFEPLERRPLGCQQAVLHRLEVLVDDIQARLGEKVVYVGNPAAEGILDGNHGERGSAVGDTGKGVLEALAGHRLEVRVRFDAGEMRIGSRLALECDFLL